MILVNFFINFFLLDITAIISKKEKILWRLILSSVIGSFYSLIIFVDDFPKLLMCLSKVVVSVLMVLVAFRFYRLLQFIKCLLIFYFSSLLILGVTIGAILLFNIKFVAINNSILYFDISSYVLILSAFLSYAISSIILRLYNRTLSKKEIYVLSVIFEGQEYKFYAFLDTGNKLREPFSNSPVIIVDKSKLNVAIPPKLIRLIPIDTVSGKSFLQSFKPDKIILKTSSKSEVIENTYIALSPNIKNKNFSAILNYDILSI